MIQAQEINPPHRFTSASAGLTLDPFHAGIYRKDLRVLGAQSCAAASCHGGPRPGVAQPSVARGNAYQLWFENDPHAQSWKTFCSPASVAMMRRLKILDSKGDVLDPKGYDNCLACHNSTAKFQTPLQNHSFTLDASPESTHSQPYCETGCQPRKTLSQNVNSFRREGVGCSACHGPSEKWIGNHFEVDQLSSVSDEHCLPNHSSKWMSEGQVDMQDLLVRARVCAACHVGDQDRDMNHDIIAAGHPPLRYEFATYHQRQPKHWRDHDATNSLDFEAQLWLAGQVAATDAMLSLLVSRSENDQQNTSLQSRPWPELSNYDCSSCHHQLGFANQRTPLERPNRIHSKSIATATASRWNVAGLTWILQRRMKTGTATDSDFQLFDAIMRVQLNLESAASPDRDEVAAAARHARVSMRDWVETVYYANLSTLNATELGSLAADAASDNETYRTWETTAQFYLAAVSARSIWPDGPAGPASSVANRLVNGLNYPITLETPRFSRSDSGQRIRRKEAAILAVELGAWLGPVSTPDLSPWQSEDDEIADLQLELRSVIEQVNRQLAERIGLKSKPRQPEIDDAPAKPDSTNGPMKTDEDKPKPRPVKSPQELLEELRQRQLENTKNPFSDD